MTLPSPPRSTGSLPVRLRRLVFGPPLATDQAEHTLLPKFLALPVFSSDAISSVAYATQQIVLALGAAGLWIAAERAAYTRYTMLVSGLIVLLLAIVVISVHRHVLCADRARPGGAVPRLAVSPRVCHPGLARRGRTGAAGRRSVWL